MAINSCPPLVISPILREAAELKIDELNHAKTAFKGRYDANTGVEATDDDVLKRLNSLLERIKKLDPYLEQDDDLPILTRYMEQAQNDRSISQAKLLRLEKDLLEKLDKYANRLEVSSLHVDLLKEALDSENHSASVTTKLEKVTLDDDFEIVEDELEAVYEKFEKNTFTSKDVNTQAIEDYLKGLFEKSGAKDELEEVRNGLQKWANDFMDGTEGIDDETILWCTMDLLKNELLSDEKKKTLQGYLQSPVALRELRGILDNKSIRHWNWRNAQKGLNVTARQNAEGKYCITVEEDVIDMLFLHSIAVGWSMKLRECLKDAISFKGVWPGNKLLDVDELDKREYYLESKRVKASNSCSTCIGMPPPPPPGLVYVSPQAERNMPPPPPPVGFPRKRKSKRRSGIPMPPPPPLPGTPNLNDERYRHYLRDFFLPRLPKRNGSSPETTSPDETQANLIKMLATEVKLREALDGSAHGLTANFESFASALPHESVKAVLKFLGVPELWLDFFTRFLAAPLNMGPVVRGTSDQVIPRTRGVPVAHGLETFFGEAMLFFLDLVVHQKTNGYLYRLRDKCYLVGQEQQRNDALQEIQEFADVMGLTVHTAEQLNAEPIGFVRFATKQDGDSNKVAIDIDEPKVIAYARRIKKQLAACGNVLEWVRTWNSTAGTYAAHLFGPLANVFGKGRLDTIITPMYNKMFEIIFDGGNLTDHVKNLMSTHLKRNLTDPPFALESLIYLPTAYGGLGVKNPYITLNLARNMLEDPTKEPERFIDAEKKYFECATENWKRITPDEKTEKLKSIFNDDKERIETIFGEGVDPAMFATFEELTKDRERAAYPYLPPPPYPAPLTFVPLPALIPIYNNLLAEPIDFIRVSDKIHDEVMRLAGHLDMKKWYKMNGEDRWMVQMYGDECFERYGGLECWHGESVPRDVLKMVRGEVVDDDDDATSVSSMSEA